LYDVWYLPGFFAPTFSTLTPHIQEGRENFRENFREKPEEKREEKRFVRSPVFNNEEKVWLTAFVTRNAQYDVYYRDPYVSN
jgi:hypothetical protein